MIVFLHTGCRHEYRLLIDNDDTLFKKVIDQKINFPDSRFAIIADIHLYDKALGISGKEYQSVLYSDRKLLTESMEIFEAIVDNIKNLEIDFVLIPGDLTKDGELHNHKLVAEGLKKILNKGIKVFVVPGNHDINNPFSYSYSEEGKTRIPSVSPREFKEIYYDFGYKDAIKIDPDSLSYIVEPIEGLWVFGIDTCRHGDFTEDKIYTGGRIKKSTLKWLEENIIRGIKKDKNIIAFMHHGILEHFENQARHFPNYVVEDFETISYIFASYNIRLVFTGHFHAQSIVYKSFNENNAYPFVFDIQTGSIVTYPCPYRIIEISQGNKAVINSYFLQTIPSYPDNFREHARQSYLETMQANISSTLRRLRINKKDIPSLSYQVAKAFLAHSKGDQEKPDSLIDTSGFSLWSRFIVRMRKDLVEGLYTNIYPKDNDLIIDLETGNTK